MQLARLIALLSQPWALERGVLNGWCNILDAKLAGQETPASLLAASLRAKGASGSPGEEPRPYELEGGIASVPVVGTLVKRNTAFSCDTTYGDVRAAIQAAQQEPAAKAVLLSFDTPGGTVAGLEGVGDFVFQGRDGGKPIYAWVDDLACSGGYWLASQSRMIAGQSSADIGSIGIATVHYDRSGRDEQLGVRRTILAVGDLKAAGSDTGPLPPEARQYILDHLNHSYALFIGAVTRGRPKLTDAAIRSMKSRVYMGDQARELGLIDRVMGRGEYLELIRSDLRRPSTVFTSVSPSSSTQGARGTAPGGRPGLGATEERNLQVRSIAAGGSAEVSSGEGAAELPALQTKMAAAPNAEWERRHGRSPSLTEAGAPAGQERRDSACVTDERSRAIRGIAAGGNSRVREFPPWMPSGQEAAELQTKRVAAANEERGRHAGEPAQGPAEESRLRIAAIAAIAAGGSAR